MMTNKYGRFGQQVLAAMIASGCAMFAKGQVESQNIVGYNTVLPESSLTDDDFCYTLANGIAKQLQKQTLT